MSLIRTRFAPSPTGNLHIGSVRTALFNFLYARSQDGEFLLRIEDTDRERSKIEFEEAIRRDLSWLGLAHDGEVVKQSRRIELYRRAADQLVGEGKAVRVDDKTQALKFIMPKKKVVVQDLIHGAVEFDTSLFEDLIIMKSDGMPTYNFACVIDDHDQGITHVIRGDDHLSNTPRQWLLYEALGFKPPKCAHIPLITGNDRAPLSKRLGDVTISFYREQGYLAAGLLNYFALLGWSPGGNQEFASLAEMIKKFTMKAVGKTSAGYDEKKLAWLNAQHIKALPKEAFLAHFRNYVSEYNPLPDAVDREYVERVALLFQNRIQTFKQFFEMAGFCWSESITYESEAAAKYLTSACQQGLGKLCARLKVFDRFDDETLLEKELRDLSEKEKLSAADLIHPARVALCGGTVSPGLFELMKTLGKVRVIRRLEDALKFR